MSEPDGGDGPSGRWRFGRRYAGAVHVTDRKADFSTSAKNPRNDAVGLIFYTHSDVLNLLNQKKKKSAKNRIGHGPGVGHRGCVPDMSKPILST